MSLILPDVAHIAFRVTAKGRNQAALYDILHIVYMRTASITQKAAVSTRKVTK